MRYILTIAMLISLLGCAGLLQESSPSQSAVVTTLADSGCVISKIHLEWKMESRKSVDKKQQVIDIKCEQLPYED